MVFADDQPFRQVTLSDADSSFHLRVTLVPLGTHFTIVSFEYLQRLLDERVVLEIILVETPLARVLSLSRGRRGLGRRSVRKFGLAAAWVRWRGAGAARPGTAVGASRARPAGRFGLRTELALRSGPTRRAWSGASYDSRIVTSPRWSSELGIKPVMNNPLR